MDNTCGLVSETNNLEMKFTIQTLLSFPHQKDLDLRQFNLTTN